MTQDPEHMADDVAAPDTAPDKASGVELAAGDDDAVRKPRGPDVINGYLKTLPNGPGVYRMLDANGDVIYVGKARSLKKRVASYTRLGGHTNRIARMISNTVSMEFVTTKTESEALLLEANLIKRFKPTFNVLLRDDKSFPYIVITNDHEAALLTKHRGARKKDGNYFGPFASAGAVNRTINTLQRAFLLRTCSDATYESRTRPCLLYQIKRCSAPCTGEIAPEEYAKLVDEANAFLSGRSDTVQKKLNTMMQEASDLLEYERAATYRNRLSALAHVQQHQDINPSGIEEADVFAAYQDGGQTCVQVFFFRTGQNWGNRAYYPKADKQLPVDEVLDAFIAQFYDDKPVPRLLLLSHDVPGRALLAEALSVKTEHKVEVSAPQRGDKRSLVDHALSNAKEALGRRLSESASQRKLLDGLARVFGIDGPIRRVEVYDNSHISGTNAVGGMIVAGPEGFAKNQYRKFNIKGADVAAGDDYAMMREVLTRRFSRLLKEHGQRPDGSDVVRAATGAGGAPGGEAGDTDQDAGRDDTGHEDAGEDAMMLPPWPDLVLVDGGKGQLSIAHDVMQELGIDNIPLVGVAKGPDRDAGREHFYRVDKPSFMLEPRDPVLYFVQRMRDEAHRYAIGTHRARRKKDIAANPLDEIAGIGPTRKRALLQHFGSAKSVSRAGVQDLQSVDGVSAAMAQSIYDFFNDGE